MKNKIIFISVILFQVLTAVQAGGLNGRIDQWVITQDKTSDEPFFEMNGKSDIYCEQRHRMLHLFSEGVLNLNVPWEGLADLQISDREPLSGAVYLDGTDRVGYSIVVPADSQVRAQVRYLMFLFGKNRDRYHGRVYALGNVPAGRVEFVSPRGFRAIKNGCDTLLLAAVNEKKNDWNRSTYFQLCGFMKAMWLGWEEIRVHNESVEVRGLNVDESLQYRYNGPPREWNDKKDLGRDGGRVTKATENQLNEVVELKSF